MNILIADDHALLRRGLKDVLFEAITPLVVDEARDGQEALVKGLSEQWDVILLDIAMPKVSGIDVLRQLKLRRPQQCILMLSMHGDEGYIARAIRYGASGYLTKEAAPDELLTAIESVLGGNLYVSPATTTAH